ncbi:hypothetical protein [Anoxynatronum buryatiense]|nr:hypothetical protein [Anoxynatronum buryatiense]
MAADSEFTSQTTDDNGNLVSETQAEISQKFADSLSETWPKTTNNKMVTTTNFVADDIRVLSMGISLIRPDGAALKIASVIFVTTWRSPKPMRDRVI